MTEDLSPSAERWRLILGRDSDPENDVPLDVHARGMDKVLEQLYQPGDRRGGLGASSPGVNRWLGDIRRYFPTPVVQVMQRDALERLNLTRMLLEPELLEGLEPDVHLAGALLALRDAMPDTTRETARQVVGRVVADLEKKWRLPLLSAARRALRSHRRSMRPRPADIDWPRTIYRNLKNYQPDLKTVIPEKLTGFARQGRTLQRVILLVDQSGSMAASVVYAGVLGAVLASLPALDTRFVAFDTAVADLSDRLGEPVDLLFGIQLGGGTDIGGALGYVQTLIEKPRETILFLISDLYEGGSRAAMLQQFEQLARAGVRVVGLLALSDEGAPAYDRDNATALAALGIPAFACTPDAFADVLVSVLEGNTPGRR